MSGTIKNVILQTEVLTLVDGVAIQGEDWHDCQTHMNDKEVEKIKDPEGATDRKEITSIPSPFARLYLAESAFKVVGEKGQTNPAYLDGKTIYHKLVSDCLDTGEIFFKYDSLVDKHQLQIVKWNKKTHIEELKNGNKQHKLLGETIELFWNEQNVNSNFARTENLYFLYSANNIIGGTSPTSLFFTTANDLSFVNITLGDDTLFDDEYCPLYKRSMSYQKYLYGLFQAYQLKEVFPAVWKYLTASLNRLKTFNLSDYKVINEILSAVEIKNAFISEFVQWEGKETVEIFPGVEHLKNKTGNVFNSEFFIDSIKYGGKLPLALENGFQRKLNYWGGLWNPAVEVPYKDNKPLKERYLPGQDEQYPYLTVSDFLEPYLIEVPYHINDQYFWTGIRDNFFGGDKSTMEEPDHSYLLPIKKQYFDYFNLDDFKKSFKDGKPRFRMVKVGIDAVRVELRVPIQANEDPKYILFERLYKKDETVDESKNIGSIRKCHFSLGFLPFYTPSKMLNQRIGLVDADVILSGHRDCLYQVNAHEITETGVEHVDYKYETTRSDEAKNHEHNGTTKYFVVDSPYDYLEVVNDNNAKGLIIPNFPPISEGSKKYIFAIDFGTTNTHVEYAEVGKDPQAFNTKEKRQLVTLFDDNWYLSNPQLEELLVRELIPYTIGKNEKYSFPLRTVVAEIEGLNHHKSVYALANINIPFHFEQKMIMKSEKVFPNLKWMPLKDSIAHKPNINRVEKFIETIISLIQNKVLLNGGRLVDTKIVWFYPSSMSSNQVGQYRRIWSKVFESYILSPLTDKKMIEEKKNNQLLDFSESEVPFYIHDDVNSWEHPVVNIDIGGGTTDVVIFKENRPKFLTSFKFAGNNVFGDGYNGTNQAKNGFVRAFKPVVATFLENNRTELNELYNLFNQMTNDPSNEFGSADLMAFFFSLENNPELKEKNLELRLSDEISNHMEFNIVFILFYGSIIYHIARLMKVQGLTMPRNISFSGNGSKIIRLLDNSSRLEGILELSKTIFEKVYEQQYHREGLGIVQGEEPKEATCKGGIMKLKKNQGKTKFDKIVLVGDAENTIVNTKSIHYPTNYFLYEELTSVQEDSVILEIETFIELLFGLHAQLDFEDSFGIDPSKLIQYKNVILRDLKANLRQGLNERLRLSDKTKNLEETLFFYPLVASIYNLTQEIAENKL